MFNSILDFAVVAIPTVLGIAGWLIPVTNSTRRHRFCLALIGIFLSVLIFFQQYRTRTSHEGEVSILNGRLERLQKTVDGVKTDSGRPITVNLPPFPVAQQAPVNSQKENGNVFLDCRMGPMPYAWPESGHIYVLDPIEGPDSMGGGGLTDYFAKPRAEAKWNNTGIPTYANRCELTNYFNRTLLNVQINFGMAFREALSLPDSPNSLREGPITVNRHWLVPISKLDPGPTGTYVFYVWNCCINRFIEIGSPEYAKGTFQGDSIESRIPLTKSTYTLREALVPSREEK